LHEPHITKESLLSYKEHLKKSNLKVSSINSKISSLNAYFSYFENESLKLKVLKCQKSLFGSKEKELTKDEFNKLYNAARNDERLKLLIETISKTGLRVSEIKYITVDAIKKGKAEIDNKGKIRTILIPRKLCIKLLDFHRRNSVSCIGESPNRISKLHGETCKGEELINCLNEFLEPTCTGELYEPIFTTRNGTPLDRKQIWQMLKNLAEKAGVPKEKAFPHNLRHLFAREFYRQTHDIVKLASILGHSSIETTKIYTKETEDECRVDMERIEILKE
jgi:site-specific recombinase XerD